MNIKENLQVIFRQVFEDDELNIFDEMTAKDIEDWDSLAHIQLIVSIQKAFNIKFSAREVLKVRNVGEFIQLIQKKIERE